MDAFEYIKGYENLYKINRNGEIYSCHYNKIMTLQKSEDGYFFVNLTKPDGLENNIIKYKRSKSRIHRLLALQYIDNPNNYPEVDHIDRNRENNSLENLRWVTKVENRRNRADIIENLTEEESIERKNKIRERARLWAEKKRRELGCKIKDEMKLTEDPEYFARKKRETRANETPEQKEERLRKRREKYRANKIK